MKRLAAALIILALAAGLFVWLWRGRPAQRQPSPPVEQPQPVAPPPIPEPPPKPQRVGEKIVYTIKLGALRVGQAVYTQNEADSIDGKKADVFVFKTRIVRFSDTERIFSDPGTSLPLRVEREILSWPKRERIVERYDQEKFTVTIEKGGRQEVIASSGPLQNAILLPFSIRECGDIGPEWKMKVNLPTQKFTIEATGREKVRVPAGEFETWHFKSEPERFEVWVTVDENRIPVKIKGSGGIGYMMLMDQYSPPALKETGDKQ